MEEMVLLLLVVVPVWAGEDTTGVAGISTGIAWPLGNLPAEGYVTVSH